LNAIDGVASHEGRVLVMTTNHPEKLDIALIRPGRVDMKIEFGLATRHQMEEIFFRMYWSDDETHDGSRSTTPTMERASMDEIVKGDVEPPVMVMGVHGLNKEEVRSMAKNFAELVPEGKISPAEIQNFLIARKKDPRKSLAEVEAWQQRMLDYGTE
jgi:chaperone BCS1